MVQHTTPTHASHPNSPPSRPLLATLARWWPRPQAAAPDSLLGYESALPWILDDEPVDTADSQHR
jgi:hypothetical protein